MSSAAFRVGSPHLFGPSGGSSLIAFDKNSDPAGVDRSSGYPATGIRAH